MTEEKGPPDLEAEIEAVRTSEGSSGLNNFWAIMPGGYRYKALQEKSDFGNTRNPNIRNGLSLREFTEFANSLREQLGIDEKRVIELQGNAQALNAYIFPVYRMLRLKNFSHSDCSS